MIRLSGLDSFGSILAVFDELKLVLFLFSFLFLFFLKRVARVVCSLARYSRRVSVGGCVAVVPLAV